MSQILDQYGHPIVTTRHFAKSADRYDRSTPTQPLFTADIDKLIPDLDRQFLVSGSRNLFQNYGPFTGLCQQKADNAVGRAWQPKFAGQDRDWGRLAVDWLENQWYGFCDVRGRAWDFKTLLWLDSVAVDRDGDVLVVLTESADGYPLTRRIPANRIGQRHTSSDQTVQAGRYKGAKMSHGVIRDKNGKALAFQILGDTIEEDVQIPAENCIHVFDPLWHDQVRGIPAISATIKLIYGSLTATEREQLNQLVRSSFALMEYNETGGPDMDDPGFSLAGMEGADPAAAPVVQSLAGGMIKYFRSNSGGKLEALDNNMPGDAWDRFQDRVVRMMAANVNWPYELVWKASDTNSAFVRNIQERARYSVEDRQDVLKNPALFQIRYAVAKAIKSGILPRPKNTDDWWKWNFSMPRKFSIDAGRDAQQRREDYKMGLKNRTQIAAEEGGDAEQMEDERIEEVFRRAQKIAAAKARFPGVEVDHREFFMLGPNDQREVPADEQAATSNDNDP